MGILVIGKVGSASRGSPGKNSPGYIGLVLGVILYSVYLFEFEGSQISQDNIGQCLYCEFIITDITMVECVNDRCFGIRGR
jgi:hypothetical protein